MKTEAFIVSIQYYEETTIPSVIILIRSEIQLNKPKQVEGMQVFSSMKDFIKSFSPSKDHKNYHKSSIILPLEEYRKSNFKVGDRLEMDISVNNFGDDVQE